MAEHRLHPLHVSQLIVRERLVSILARRGAAGQGRRNRPKSALLAVQLQVDVLAGGLFAREKLPAQGAKDRGRV